MIVAAFYLQVDKTTVSQLRVIHNLINADLVWCVVSLAIHRLEQLVLDHCRRALYSTVSLPPRLSHHPVREYAAASDFPAVHWRYFFLIWHGGLPMSPSRCYHYRRRAALPLYGMHRMSSAVSSYVMCLEDCPQKAAELGAALSGMISVACAVSSFGRKYCYRHRRHFHLTLRPRALPAPSTGPHAAV